MFPCTSILGVRKEPVHLRTRMQIRILAPQLGSEPGVSAWEKWIPEVEA